MSFSGPQATSDPRDTVDWLRKQNNKYCRNVFALQIYVFFVEFKYGD
jgi:hypothetical protein